MASNSPTLAMAECDPLLPKPTTNHQQRKRRCFRKMRYRMPVISEKGAVIMIIWNFFFLVSSFSSVSQTLQWNYIYVQAIEFVVILSLSIIIDAVANCWFGRYRILRMAMYVLLLAIIFGALGTLIIPSEKGSLILIYTATGFQALAIACYSACVIQFITDQLIGASGEQLSFTIYWIVWGYIAGGFISMFIVKLYLLSDEERQIVLFGISSLSLIIAICLIDCGNHLLMTKPLLCNPIKHIAKVFNYARQHKYPEQRSALTYWEDDCPSRIDLGKNKYGGPFTVKEVEDVKTFLFLIPVVAISTSLIIPLGSKLYLIISVQSLEMYSIEFHSTYTIPGLIFLFSLPIYHTIIYPLFYNHIPGMLTRMGIGYFLSLLYLLSQCFVDIVKNSNVSNITCPSESEDWNSADSWWEVAPSFFFAYSVIVFLYALFEFVISQSPHHAKGVMLCIMYACSSLLCIISIVVSKLLQKIEIKSFPGCNFYIYLIYSIITVILLILFFIASKWYKQRQRNNVGRYHMLTEEHSERS